MAYGARDATTDVDVRIRAAHNAVISQAHLLADRHQLPRSWLNEQGTAYLPTIPDRAGIVVFDAPGLSVTAASPPVLLSMKIAAARRHDVNDIEFLARVVGARDRNGLEAVFRAWFPSETLTDRSVAALDEVAGRLARRPNKWWKGKRPQPSLRAVESTSE